MALCIKRDHLCTFKQLYIAEQHERQLIMNSLDICVSYSTYLSIFQSIKTPERPEFSLNYVIVYLIDYTRIT